MSADNPVCFFFFFFSLFDLIRLYFVLRLTRQIFEMPSRGIIGLERLMLEASGFDFRTRHPQKTLIKLARKYGLTAQSAVSNTAYRISQDLYRTFAPIKQTSSTMAFACLELAGRLLDERSEAVEQGRDYHAWRTSREEVMGEIFYPYPLPNISSTPTPRCKLGNQLTKAETLFDLLELYTHNRASTTVGPHFPADRFLTVRIPLNKEAEAQRLPRYTHWVDDLHSREQQQQQPNGSAVQNGGPPRPLHPLTPVTANGERPRANEKGRDGAVRFMLDPECAEAERARVAEFFKVEMEEYRVDD